MEKALAIPELLEAILLHLPIIDILVNAQRVCKTWHDCVEGSTPLQRTLFLRPDLPPIGNRSSNGECTVDLSLRRVNSFGDLISIKEHTNRTAAFDRPGASWRSMLIIQPPVPMISRRDARTMRFSDVHNQSGLPKYGQVFSALTFGHVEMAMGKESLHVRVQVGGTIYWMTAAFQYDVDQLHWTTA